MPLAIAPRSLHFPLRELRVPPALQHGYKSLRHKPPELISHFQHPPGGQIWGRKVKKRQEKKKTKTKQQNACEASRSIIQYRYHGHARNIISERRNPSSGPEEAAPDPTGVCARDFVYLGRSSLISAAQTRLCPVCQSSALKAIRGAGRRCQALQYSRDF